MVLMMPALDGKCGRAASQSQNIANTLVRKVALSCSVGRSAIFSTWTCLPATLTRMSGPPSLATASSTSRSQKPTSEMSPGSAIALRPAASTSFTTSRASASSLGK